MANDENPEEKGGVIMGSSQRSSRDAEQSRKEENRAEQSREAEQSRKEENGAEQSRKEENRAEQSRKEENRARQIREAERETDALFSSLDPKQLEEFRTQFNLFDLDGNGNIAVEELGTVMRSLGLDPTPDEVAQMMEEANLSGQVDQGDSTMEIDFKQFCLMMAKKLKMTDLVEEQRKAFRVFDQDGDGYISPGELHAVMWQLGNIVTEEEVDEMIREADRDGNGLIDFYEFSHMLAGGAILHS